MNKEKIKHHLDLARINLNIAKEEIRTDMDSEWCEGYEDGWIESIQVLILRLKERML